MVAQAFQPVQAQAKACGYRRLPFDRKSVSALSPKFFFFSSNFPEIFLQVI
jgi:hypothetical protein